MSEPIDFNTDRLTTERGVHEFTQLAELCELLAGRLGGWSTDGADPSSAGTMSSLAGRLTEHAEWWRNLIPESVLLLQARDEASDPARLDAVLSMLEVVPTARKAALAPVLAGLVAHLVGLLEHSVPVCDAPTQRVVRLVLADLEDQQG
ncbi:MAG: hypothetical protein P8M16_10305 [Acidimicrobiales bacterium]|nr:hypothetical protein [Acidimicrobiales bacterium]